MSKIRIFVRHLMLFCSDPASHLKKSFHNQHTLCSYQVFHLFAYALFFLFCQLCRSDTNIFSVLSSPYSFFKKDYCQ